MKDTEALSLLDAKLAEYHGRSHDELRTLIGRDLHVEVKGASGTQYQMEIQVLWDHKLGGDIRVVGSIDDGGLRAIVPLCRAFLKGPDRPPC